MKEPNDHDTQPEENRNSGIPELEVNLSDAPGGDMERPPDVVVEN